MESRYLHPLSNASVLSFTSIMDTFLTDNIEWPENLSNRELMQAVERLRTDNHLAKLENEIFEKYIQEVYPVSLLKFQAEFEEVVSAINAAIRMKRVASVIESSTHNLLRSTYSLEKMEFKRGIKRTSVVSLQRPGFVSVSTAHLQPLLAESEVKLSIGGKESVVERVTERLRNSLETFQISAKEMSSNLQSELQTNNFMLQDTKDSIKKLEMLVVTEGEQSITGKVREEKLKWFIKEWFRKHDRTIEKLRLFLNGLNRKLTHVTERLIEKQELEKVTVGDFKKLQVMNEECVQKLEEKYKCISELKKLSTQGILSLSQEKEDLNEQIEALNRLQRDVKMKEKRYTTLLKEKEIMKKEVEKTKKESEDVKELLNAFEVPDTIEYVKITAKLQALKREMKKWERKAVLQKEHVRLVNRQHRAQINRLKTLQREDPSRFPKYLYQMDENGDFKFQFEKKVRKINDRKS